MKYEHQDFQINQAKREKVTINNKMDDHCRLRTQHTLEQILIVDDESFTKKGDCSIILSQIPKKSQQEYYAKGLCKNCMSSLDIQAYTCNLMDEICIFKKALQTSDQLIKKIEQQNKSLVCHQKEISLKLRRFQQKQLQFEQIQKENLLLAAKLDSVKEKLKISEQKLFNVQYRLQISHQIEKKSKKYSSVCEGFEEVRKEKKLRKHQLSFIELKPDYSKKRRVDTLWK